ncbi:phospholipid scramblase 4-like isoform X2 [Notamacropus eugenii]|uniref:phospholipid scramblase 4-like isoform X2 n=1 Tax=Notamacropus eugenii TaxID=9315 RepID=UPI003B67C9B3
MQAPTAPIDDAEKFPEAPPSYVSQYQPGSSVPVSHPIAGYAGPGPVGYPYLNQPGGFPMYPSGGQPIVYPPGINMNINPPPQISWMPGLPPLPNCPPGLEYLSQLDKILVHQQIEILELITQFESNNRYEVKNSLGQMVYMVLEDTDDITRNMYHSSRPFVLRVIDCMGREVMRMERPLWSDCCCFCCSGAMQELEIQSPPGVTFGYVVQQGGCCKIMFRIESQKREHMLNIHGPCDGSCSSDTVFWINTLDGGNIGKIRRQWRGFLPATVPPVDNFEITFPPDLDIPLKALIFATTFLIDFMLFETRPTPPTQQNQQIQ